MISEDEYSQTSMLCRRTLARNGLSSPQALDMLRERLRSQLELARTRATTRPPVFRPFLRDLGLVRCFLFDISGVRAGSAP